MITSDLIKSAWSKVRSKFEPKSDLGDIHETLSSNSVEIDFDHLSITKREHPILFENGRYDWISEPSVYESSVEYSLQLRLLRALGCYVDEFPHLLPNAPIVVKVFNDPLFAYNTPFLYKTGQQNHDLFFILLPHNWYHTIYLTISSFISYCTENSTVENRESLWKHCVQLTKPNHLNTDKIDGMICHALSSKNAQGNDPNLSRAMAEKIKAEILEFSKAQLDVDETTLTPLGADMSYMLTDFSLLHEVGHILKNHGSKNSVEHELEADISAFELFAYSQGWRHEILTEIPLNQALSAAFCYRLFLFYAKVGLTLWSFENTQGDYGLSERLVQMKNQLGKYSSFYPAHSNDFQQLEMLDVNFEKFIRHVQKRTDRVTKDVIDRVSHLRL